jgi:hypothetical protein
MLTKVASALHSVQRTAVRSAKCEGTASAKHVTICPQQSAMREGLDQLRWKLVKKNKLIITLLYGNM